MFRSPGLHLYGWMSMRTAKNVSPVKNDRDPWGPDGYLPVTAQLLPAGNYAAISCVLIVVDLPKPSDCDGFSPPSAPPPMRLSESICQLLPHKSGQQTRRSSAGQKMFIFFLCHLDRGAAQTALCHYIFSKTGPLHRCRSRSTVPSARNVTPSISSRSRWVSFPMG